GCMLQYTCVYSYIFETPIPANSKVMKKQSHVPHPFVLSDISDLQKNEIKAGERFQFSMTLVGKSIDFVPYCVYAMICLGHSGIGKGRGKFKLLSIKEKDANNQCGDDIYVDDQLNMPQQFLNVDIVDNLIANYFNDTNKITLHFISPFRIKYHNKICDHIEFHIIIRSLIRRLANLAYFHCNSKCDIDFNDIIEKARSVKIFENKMSWYDWGRYSTRQKEWMKLGGLIGDITYEGNICEFIPFLILGTWVSVGKGTAFGLGNYRIS
ncbi:CRISPR-associated protein Cas6, partial [Candidatus Magnetomorum sp. HK-1]